MVLLSRIRQQQGKLNDALRLSSKALAFRQQLLGSRLKTCDSFYQVASLLQLRGDLSSAMYVNSHSSLLGPLFLIRPHLSTHSEIFSKNPFPLQKIFQKKLEAI